MRRFICFLSLVLCFHLLAASNDDVVGGMVFLDINKNGKPDPGEPGIERIAVSNGEEVVLTNAAGKWELPEGNGPGVFVIKPSGYAVPLNQDNIPQHYLLYEGTGEPGVRSPGEIHFPLYESVEEKKFSVLFFADTQARGLREVNFILRDVVEECIGTDAALGVSLGDIVADDPGLFTEINQGIGKIGIPWYNIFGNHDNDRDAITNSERDATFRRFFGPSTYAFEYGQVAFIGLNNIYFSEEGRYRTHFSEKQLRFVENYLDYVPDHMLVVLMMHAPLVRSENRERLYEILKDRMHTFSISGHVHRQINLFIDEEMGWKGPEPHHHLINATVSGSWWCGLKDELGIPHATMNDGAPNGYSVVTFDENTYSVRFKAARRPAGYQMNIYLPDEMKVHEADTTTVLVNIFAGSGRSKVEMLVDDHGKWIPMDHVETIDPECLRMHRLNPVLDLKFDDQPLDRILGWKMDYPSVSTHMWQANLPGGLKPGTHMLTIRTTDMYNQEWISHRIFRVRSN